ncbi:MAG: hypothetical protein GY950_29765 [bacterium]|nr:hypothetical protein [bacterium]
MSKIWKVKRRVFTVAVLGAAFLVLFAGLSFLTDALESPAEGIEEGFSEVVIFATNSVHLQQNAVVLSGDVVTNDSSPGPTLSLGRELVVGIGVETPAEYALYADSIKLKSGALVRGDVFVNELDNNGQVLGDILPVTLPVFESLPPFRHGPSEGETPPDDVLVEIGQMLELPEGTYGDVTVKLNGKILFTGGVYNFRSIDFRDATNMSFAAPSEIRVKEKFATGQNSYIGPEDGSGVAASEIVFYIKGINGTTGNLGATPKAAKIGLNNNVFANFYVANGTLHIKMNTEATGAFLGLDVDAGKATTFTLDSYFAAAANPPVAVPDSARVSIGGTVSVLLGGAASVLDNDYDPEGGELTVTTTPVSGPNHGTLVLNSDGTFLYTHDGGTSSEDGFTYEVCNDGSPSACSTGEVSILVNPGTIILSVETAGEGTGLLESSPGGISCDTACEAEFGTEQVIFLSATADPGSVFAGWSGDEDCLDGMIIPDGDKHCIANFDLEPPPNEEEITLTITKSGAGTGQVVTSPGGIDCGTVCSNTFLKFSRIQLVATPDAGSQFLGWSGDEDCADGFLNASGDINCTATFGAAPQTYTLRVRVIGTGMGDIGSTVGLYCNNDCTVEVDQGVDVRLTGRAQPGSVFAGWGGDVTGGNFFIDFTMDSDKEITATFNLD